MFGGASILVVSVGRKVAENEDVGGFQADVTKPILTHSRRVGGRAFFSSSVERDCLGLPSKI